MTACAEALFAPIPVRPRKRACPISRGKQLRLVGRERRGWGFAPHRFALEGVAVTRCCLGLVWPVRCVDAPPALGG